MFRDSILSAYTLRETGMCPELGSGFGTLWCTRPSTDSNAMFDVYGGMGRAEGVWMVWMRFGAGIPTLGAYVSDDVWLQRTLEVWFIVGGRALVPRWRRGDVLPVSGDGGGDAELRVRSDSDGVSGSSRIVVEKSNRAVAGSELTAVSDRD